MWKPIAGAALLALLAACGQAPSQNAEAVTQPAPDGGYANAMRAMPDGQRNATLYRAIADAGRDCQQVDRSEEAGAVNGKPAWTATCHNGATWIVVIGENGMATVTNATELQAARKQP
jgi:hypothetical protein